ncbi:hypothetical protein PAXRUDRAFT_718321 [Paxillus rubicundulus Ve08.2h10]|uniref:Uncharacterized protein n=1 Tax=Paxillus rubicundulus Ve08.2h10 TaxID=930991 RepID=A0A0D0DRK9_9AGAM|nr:hypothetical protein PAXRUDRAFT_718321 [Paxillus rubicundulus Ve08.2h10]
MHFFRSTAGYHYEACKRGLCCHWNRSRLLQAPCTVREGTSLTLRQNYSNWASIYIYISSFQLWFCAKCFLDSPDQSVVVFICIFFFQILGIK